MKVISRAIKLSIISGPVKCQLRRAQTELILNRCPTDATNYTAMCLHEKILSLASRLEQEVGSLRSGTGNVPHFDKKLSAPKARPSALKSVRGSGQGHRIGGHSVSRE